MIPAVAFLFALSAVPTQQKLETKLVDLKIVSQAPTAQSFMKMEESSIGGIIVNSGFVFAPQSSASEGTLVFSIPAGTTSFKGLFGYPDSSSGASVDVATLGVYLDGDLIREFNASRNLKPTKVELPTNGAKSLKLVFRGYSALGDPTFSSLGSKPPTENTPPKQDGGSATPPSALGKIALTSPENGEKVRDKLAVKWDAVEGAVAYGLEIVLVSTNSKTVPSKYLRAFTVKGTQFEWAFTDDVVSGEYQVSVIAFGKKGVITRFSPSRKFVVDRRSSTKAGNQ